MGSSELCSKIKDLFGWRDVFFIMVEVTSALNLWRFDYDMLTCHFYKYCAKIQI